MVAVAMEADVTRHGSLGIHQAALRGFHVMYILACAKLECVVVVVIA